MKMFTKSFTQQESIPEDGIARAVQPSHTPLDGDLIFAVSTGQHDALCDAHDLAMLGHGAALCMTRAICRGVWQADVAAGDHLPVIRDLIGTE